MATLNIKNFPEALHRRIRKRARKGRRSIAQEVIQILDEATRGAPPVSLLDLEGLGREVWEGELDKNDQAGYIRDERDSWS